MNAGILPVKRPDRAKQRLAEHLSDRERLAVTRALLHDAFGLCSSADTYSWWVVSDDPDVLTDAERRGFTAVTDPGSGLNDALEAAIAVAMGAGAESVTVIPADVPLAWKGDLQDIADTGATSDVVVVPSRDGGTNALYMSPGDVMKPLFGKSSLKAHIAEAERLGKRCTILSLPRLELDIDTVADIDAYLERPKAAETESSVVLAKVRAS